MTPHETPIHLDIPRPRERFKERDIRFLELWRVNRWVVKAYAVSYSGTPPSVATVTAAKHVTAQELPQPACCESRYGVGFAIVHEGQDAVWLLIHWWGLESILHQRLLTAQLGETTFRRAPQDVVGCVWELPVIMFERDRWVDCILSPPHPDVQGYLDGHLAIRPSARPHAPRWHGA